jgi:hypothetical protein
MAFVRTEQQRLTFDYLSKLRLAKSRRESIL